MCEIEDPILNSDRIRNTSVGSVADPDTVFVKTSPKSLFIVIEYSRFGLDLAKTGSINSDTGVKIVLYPGSGSAHSPTSCTVIFFIF